MISSPKADLKRANQTAVTPLNHVHIVIEGGIKMNPFVQQMINYKINTLSPAKLGKLASQYDVPVSMEQARVITAIMHEEEIDIMDKEQCKRLLAKISKHVDPSVAKKIEALLEVFR